MPEPPSRESPVKASALLASARNVALPWWLSLIVIVGALLLAAGAVIALLHPALLVAPGEEINGAARVYAGYLVSRNLAIAAMLLGTFILRARRALSHVMVLTAVIQILDAVIDGWEPGFREATLESGGMARSPLATAQMETPGH